MYTIAFKLNILSTVSMLPQALSCVFIFLSIFRLPGWKGYCFIIRILFMVIIFAISGKIILMFISIFIIIILFLFGGRFASFFSLEHCGTIFLYYYYFRIKLKRISIHYALGAHKKITTKSNAQDIRHLSLWLGLSLFNSYYTFYFFMKLFTWRLKSHKN